MIPKVYRSLYFLVIYHREGSARFEWYQQVCNPKFAAVAREKLKLNKACFRGHGYTGLMQRVVGVSANYEIKEL